MELKKYELSDVFAPNVEAKRYKAVTLADDPEAQPLCIVSSKTVLFEHEDVEEIVRNAVGDAEISVDYQKDDTIMFMSVKLPHEVVMPDDDRIATGFEVVNMYNAPRTILAPYTFRYVCTNEMTHTDGMQRFPHRSDTPSLFESELGALIIEFGEYNKMIEKKYNLWLETPIDVEIDSEAMATLLTVLEKNYVPKRYIKELKEYVDLIRSVWDLFNALTQLNTHDTRRTMWSKFEFNRWIERSMDDVITLAENDYKVLSE